METYIFHEGRLPSDISLDFEPAIFNWPQFGLLQHALGWVSYYLVDQKRKKAVAGIHFNLEGKSARSPYHAPFGSVEFSHRVNPTHLYAFLENIELKLREKGIVEIFIKNPPHAYDPAKSSLLETFFLNQKYSVSQAEVSAVIPVTTHAFSGIIRNSEKLRLRQSEKAGLKFRVLPADKAGVVYDFISEWHKEKGYKVSIAPEDFQRTFLEFPGRYLLFAVVEKDAIRAAAISIRVTTNILSNFLTNHECGYNRLSPPVLLMQGIFDYCQRNKIALLDLGTSALNGKPNFSLMDFKLHLGGIPASKLSFYKNTR